MMKHFGGFNRFINENYHLIFLSILKLLLLLIFAGNYGFFRDEFYYIACSKNLAWGYVDQQPLNALILAISRLLFGESLIGIRIFAYIAGSAVVFISGLLAREFGASKPAESITALAVIFSGTLLRTSGNYSIIRWECPMRM